MKNLLVPFLSFYNEESTLNDVEDRLDEMEAQSLDNLLWSRDGYKPQVWFIMAYDSKHIFLKYTIFENDVRAVYNKTNDPVYKDSCVAFFFAFDYDENYYNIEFNCLGTCAIGYGNNQYNRITLPVTAIEKIGSQTKLWRMNNGEFTYCWDLTLVIPVSVFVQHPDIDFNRTECRANFYKCGDECAQPHYLSWSSIDSEHRNFHVPEFFGSLQFE